MTLFENDVTASTLPKRSVWTAMKRGFMQKCPQCGSGALFSRYLKVTDTCDACGEALHHHRADDAPAYFTIAIVGKVVVGLFVWLELAYAPPYWLHAVIWTPVLLAMSLGFLPLMKGAIVGLQWANYMHGFNPNFVEGDDIEMPGDDRLKEQGVS
ncbi:MAG: DUF983 domain-containing protein [Pseudomonadota bacterium]